METRWPYAYYPASARKFANNMESSKIRSCSGHVFHYILSRGKTQELPVSDLITKGQENPSTSRTRGHEQLSRTIKAFVYSRTCPNDASRLHIIHNRSACVYSRTCPNDASTRHMYAAKSSVVASSGLTLIKGTRSYRSMRILAF